MAYAHTTLGQLKTRLAARLSDTSKVFWTDAELGLAVIESLRIWNALTGHSRARGSISASAGQAFYDLSTSLYGAGSALLRPRTIRDRGVVSEIEYHLVEPQGLSTWAGSDQFTLDQIVKAVQQRRDRLLGSSACVLTELAPIAVAAGDTYVDLPDNVIAVRRGVYHFGNRYSPLSPSDERTTALTLPFSWTAGTPRTFSVAASQPLRLTLTPPPSNTGTLELLAVCSGAALDTAAGGGTGTLLGVPDDVAWAVKWGALADLLGSDAGRDDERALAAEQLYTLGVGAASMLPVVLNAEINGRPTVPATMRRTDTVRGGWQGQARGVPQLVSIAGPELVALTPVADDACTLTLDVVANADVPASATDDAYQLQLGREHLDAISGMAQWHLLFKIGGSELGSAAPMLEAFMSAAQQYTYQRAAVASLLSEMLRTSPDATVDPELQREPPQPQGGDPEGSDVRSERNARRRKVRI